ncbi:NAD-dependent protein deacetylase sirtuin-1-like [Ptychodera flava]|uniref:NAD-dependent protein deacetylase sirtuin-1-like n=1 Tax=Ptychodera flava TaxID=63121 RepID=UPI00396A9B7E
MADESEWLSFGSSPKRQKIDDEEITEEGRSVNSEVNSSSRPYTEHQSHNLQATGTEWNFETPVSSHIQPWQAQLIDKPEVAKSEIPNEPGCSQSLSVHDDPPTNVTFDDAEANHNNMAAGDSDSDESLDLHLGSWQPELEPGPMSWVQQKMLAGVNPKDILHKMIPHGGMLPEGLDEFTMWKIIISILSEPRRRKKLKSINTMEDVLHLLRTKSKIVVLTGAGVSVSCGIPDFRSRDGIYARLAVDFPDLPDPQAMFDISYFWTNPRPFFKFAKEIYPGQFQPSVSHKFIGLLEEHGKLLRNYTQNIDTLEQVANITKVVQCHGSFATASCTRCRYQVDCEVIRQDIFNQVVPQCPRCQLPEDSSDFAVMKPDIVFFGEGLPATFHKQIDEDREEVDLLIVIGSSLKVRPVALIPHSIPSDIPQILINREPLSHMTFDVELLGDCDGIINELCHRLGPGFNHLCSTESPLSETKEIPQSVYETMATPPYDSGNDTQLTLLDDLSQTEYALNSDSIAVADQKEGKKSEDQCVSSDLQEGSTSQKTDNETDQGLTEEMHSDVEHRTDDNRTESIQHDKPRPKAKDLSISSHLSENAYLHIPPCRYIFKGAEVFAPDCMFSGNISDVDSQSDLSSLSSRPNDDDIDDLSSSLFDNSGQASIPFATGNSQSGSVQGGEYQVIQGHGRATTSTPENQENAKATVQLEEEQSLLCSTSNQGCQNRSEQLTESGDTGQNQIQERDKKSICGGDKPQENTQVPIPGAQEFHCPEKSPCASVQVSEEVPIPEHQKPCAQMPETENLQIQFSDKSAGQILNSQESNVHHQDNERAEFPFQNTPATQM